MSTLTKIFIVLQLVFSLVLSVLVIVLLNGQVKYKDQVEGAERARIATAVAYGRQEALLSATRTELNTLAENAKTSTATWAKTVQERDDTIAQLRRDIAERNAQLALVQADVTKQTAIIESLKNQNQALMAENKDLRPKLLDAQQKYAEISRKNDELAYQILTAERQIRRLKEAHQQMEEELSKRPTAQGPAAGGAVAGAAGGSVPAMSAGLQTPAQVNGKINRVAMDSGRTYITMALGKRDGVRENTHFTIYRGNQYVGDATVRNVSVDESVAVVTVLKNGMHVEAGDMVISGQ